jgi:hypothetical protein
MTQTVLNSSLTVMLTLQVFQPDSFLPFMDELIKKGFMVNHPRIIQETQVETGPLARKGTTTNIAIDYINRRIVIQITNNIKSPHENLNEILSVLYAIGYNSEEFIERIDITGTVVIKTSDSNSEFINAIVKDEFKEKVGEILNSKVEMTAIRISSTESLMGDISKSPFMILFEPLFTDALKSKFQVRIAYASSKADDTIKFMENLYDSLKKIILGDKNESD